MPRIAGIDVPEKKKIYFALQYIHGIGQKFAAPSGFTLEMDGNHHLHKPVMIGEVRADGQFNVVWKTPAPIRAQPWSPFIPGNEKKKDGPEAM